MKTYVARRLLALVPVALVVATVAFVLIHLAPGDPASVIAGPDASADDVRRIERQLGLDAPLPVQLVRWYARLARGDLGQSIFLRKPVTEAILDRVEPTLLLTLFAIAIAVAIGVPAGVISARHHDSATDQALMVVALLGVSIPNFLLGLLLILWFSVWLGWFPVAGYSPLEDGLARTLRSLVLPAFALGLVQSALIARIARSSMLDVLGEPFIMAGRAKGLGERAVVYKHALKNAMIPTVTIIGISFAILISGAVVVETVFNIPGLGRLIISAVLRRDYPVIQGVVLCIAGVSMLINLAVDPAVGALAPLLAGDPAHMDVAGRLAAPGRAHWFGTDDVGRDVWSRVVYGARLSSLVGLAVVALSFVVGVACGLVAGYYPRLDNLVMRVMDGLMAFPAIVLAIALMAALGPSVVNVIVAIAVVYSPRVARVVRGSVLVIRETSYVEAARALGASDLTLIGRHVLPNCLSPVIVQASFVFAAAVLTEAALSFLGVGVPPWVPSWGNVLAEGRLYLQQAPWLVLYPGAAIMLTIFGLNLFGDGLRDLLDPKIRGLQTEKQRAT